MDIREKLSEYYRGLVEVSRMTDEQCELFRPLIERNVYLFGLYTKYVNKAKREAAKRYDGQDTPELRRIAIDVAGFSAGKHWKRTHRKELLSIEYEMAKTLKSINIKYHKL